MADRVRAGGLRVRHRAREVHAQVTVKVVGRDVIRGVRHVVRAADVGLAVRERDPDHLRRPRLLVAERLVHDRRVLRRRRLGVHVLVLAHDAQRPGVAGLKVEDRAQLAVLVVSAPVGVVGEDDLAGALGKARGGRGAGAAASRRGRGALVQVRGDGGERLAARDAVGGQALRLLEGDDGRLRLLAEVAGQASGVVAQRLEVRLQRLDRVGIGAQLHQRRGRAGRGGAGGGRAAAQLFLNLGERLAARDAVGVKPVVALELGDGLLGQVAVVAGDGAVLVVAERLEVRLKRFDRVGVLYAVLEHGGARRGGRRGAAGGRGAGGGAAAQLFLDLGERLRADHAVGGQAVLALEVHDRGLGLAAEVAAHGTGVVAQLRQILLELAHGFVLAAIAQQRGLAGARAGGGGAARRVDPGGVIERLDRVIARDAVGGERILFLEGLNGRLRLFTVVAGDAARVELERRQRGLDGGDFIGFIAQLVALRKAANAAQREQQAKRHSRADFLGRGHIHEGIRLLSFPFIHEYFMTVCNICQELFKNLPENRKQTNVINRNFPAGAS